MLAKDVMTKDVLTVQEETPLKEVARIMVENKISGLPVVDGDFNLLGIVTESDLLIRAKKLDLPMFLPFIGGVFYLESPDRLEKELKKMTATKAGEIMSKRVHSVGPDETVTNISTLMVEEKVNRLPVLEDRKLLGMITRSDVIRAIASELE